MRWLLIIPESGAGGAGCGCLVLIAIIGMIGSCYEKYVTIPKYQAANKKIMDENIQRAASVGAVDLDVELQKNGLESMSDLAQFGNSHLQYSLKHATDTLRKAEEDYKRANAINQPDIQSRINETQAEITQIQRQIEKEQAEVASKTYLCRGHTYSTLNEQRDGDQSSCTIRIWTVLYSGFTDTKVSFSVPNVTLVGEVENRDGYIEFSVSGSTESLKKLVNDSKYYQVMILLKNLRYNTRGYSIEWWRSYPDVLAIDIVEVQ